MHMKGRPLLSVILLPCLLIALLELQQTNAFLTPITGTSRSTAISTGEISHRQVTPYSSLDEKQKFGPSMSNIKKKKTTTTTWRSMNDEISIEKDHHPTASISSFAYKGLSLAYAVQVIMTLNRRGPTIPCFNVINGPCLAAAISLILSYHNSDIDVPSKLMNGTLVLYSMVCLTLVYLVPQVNKPFGLLYMMTGLSAFFISSKGYCNQFPNFNCILKQTKRILPRIQQANMSIPKDLNSLLYMVCMVNVILLKGGIIAEVMKMSTFSYTILAYKVGFMAKLTVLGGSLVTLRDGTNQKLLKQSRFRILNLFVSYVFGSMAGTYMCVCVCVRLFVSVDHESFLLLICILSCCYLFILLCPHLCFIFFLFLSFCVHKTVMKSVFNFAQKGGLLSQSWDGYLSLISAAACFKNVIFP